MRSILLALFTVFLLLQSCDKKVKDYSEIMLFDSAEKEILLTQLSEELRIFVFMSPECPLSENYSRTLAGIQRKYLDADVVIYYVFPGVFYPKEQILQFLKTYSIPVEKALFDPEYQLRDYCKASITPEVFIIDWAGKIEYSGAIDNWAITLGKQRQVITEHYLQDAIDSIVKGEKLKVNKTRAVGCIIE